MTTRIWRSKLKKYMLILNLSRVFLKIILSRKGKGGDNEKNSDVARCTYANAFMYGMYTR